VAGPENTESALRVLHVPTSVGGNPQGLSRHLRLQNVRSENWVLEQNYLGYACDRVIWSPTDGFISRELKRWRAILDAVRFADVIHFNFGTSLAYPVRPFDARDGCLARRFARWLFSMYTQSLQWIELNLYRLAGIPMMVHYQGDDARQGDESVARFRVSIAANVEAGYYDASSDRFKRRMIRRMARYCEMLYALNPDLLHILPPGTRFTPYSHISLAEWLPRYPDPDGTAPLRIGHAPSHRRVKGTDLVLKAVEALRAEGLQLEIVLVEGQSHEAAKRQYESIDVLVDQLYAGWYGGLAVEAMALGKPVLVYIRKADLRLVPEAMARELPFVVVDPNTIVDGLRTVAAMSRSELHALGRRSRAFVERWHDPIRIAGDMKLEYEAALSRRGKRRMPARPFPL
jgi:hypothetical protein